MFSTLYGIARGVATGPDDQDARNENVRVKRAPRKARAAPRGGFYGEPCSPPPPYEDINLTDAERAAQNVRRAKVALIDQVLQEEDLYRLLGVSRTAKIEEIRRGFLMRSRVCHPDKFPGYPPSTLAFQRISLAYETLSKPASRRMYDVSGRSDLSTATPPSFGEEINDETLNGVLRNVFSEFMDGDFEMIRVMISALNEANPGLDLGEDCVQNFEGVFKRIPAVVLTGQKYFRIIRFELIRLYETQHALRQLSYFDIFGRLRLTLQLARVTLNIPMAIDRAMINSADAQAEEESSSSTEKQDSTSHSQDDDDSTEEEGPGPEVEFGLADDVHEAARRAEAKERYRAAKAARAARKAQRAKADPQGHIPQGDSFPEAWGLLGPAGRGLLGGIVSALEASEGWVPGNSGKIEPEFS